MKRNVPNDFYRTQQMIEAQDHDALRRAERIPNIPAQATRYREGRAVIPCEDCAGTGADPGAIAAFGEPCPACAGTGREVIEYTPGGRRSSRVVSNRVSQSKQEVA